MIETSVSFLVDFFRPLHFVVWIGYLAPFVVARVFAWSKKHILRDSILIIFLALIGSLFSSIPDFIFSEYERMEQPLTIAFVAIDAVYPVILLFAYFYKLKSFKVKNAIIFAIVANATRFVAMMVTTLIFTTLFDMPAYFRPQYAMLNVYWAVFQVILSAIFAFLVLKLLGPIIGKGNKNSTVGTALMIVALVSWGTYEAIRTTMLFIGGGVVYMWMTIVLFVFACILVAVFYIYMKSLTAKLIIQQQEVERKNLLFYMEEIEEQQVAIRKFKHDQQNLFSTLDIFIQNKDWDGMLQFYTKMRDAFATITKDALTLEGLSKVKMREAKNILLAKIVMAQNLGIDIRVEIADEIDEVSVEPVALVRMLGIILDNAIEELQYLGEGQLLISCFKGEGAVNFVVQNSCRADLPPIRQLRQPGFSTKGKERGLGLNNLYELTNAHLNTALLTDTNDGKFTQTLIIGGTV